MKAESSIEHQNASSKHRKIHRSRPLIASKVVACDVLTRLEHRKKTAREAAAILEVPNSTMQSWQAIKRSQKSAELEVFFSTPVGAELLQRIVMAAQHVAHYGPSGIQGVQEYLQLSGLSPFVASSNGALQSFTERCERHIVVFGENEEKRLAGKIRARKITAALDEMFRGRQPCLVAIEVVSNFILLEKFTENRKSETWKQEINTRLVGLDVEIDQVVSDFGTGITACAKELGAQHSPDLFHGQHELSKAVSGALAVQKRAFEKELKEADERVQKAVAQWGKESEKAKQAIAMRNLRQYGLKQRTKRQEAARAAIKAIGTLHHPIDLTTGKAQRVEAVEQGFNRQLKTLEEIAREAQLSQSCLGRLEKAGRAFDGMLSYMKMILAVLAAYVGALGLNEEQRCFFMDVIYPLAYIRMIWRRLSRKERKGLKQLRDALDARIREGPWPEKLKEEWLTMGKECAERFQRSSSCVEGRNGMLSLLHHRQHRLNKRRLRTLTVVHNYHIRRTDGTTAAERFFGAKHEKLFESVVANVRIPGRPQKQYHDAEKRLIGWEKRRVA